MTISRGQMERQLRMGGGIMNIVPREPAILGGIKKAVKKVGKTVGKIAKSDLGKAALLYAGTAGLGALGAGQAGTGFKFLGKGSFLSPGNVLANLGAAGRNLGILKSIPDAMQVPTREGPLAKLFDNPLSAIGIGGDKGGGFLTKGLALAGLSTFLTDQYGMSEEQVEETLANPESRATYLRRYYQNLNPGAGEEEVEEFVSANVAEYMAEGGRIGFAEGPVLPPDPTQPVNPFGPKPGDFGIEEDISIKMASAPGPFAEYDDIARQLFGKGYKDLTEEEKLLMQEELQRLMDKYRGEKEMEQTRGLAAIGGKMDTASDNAMQAAGIEGLPIRQNKAGVKELDLRETGGFIQPVGIKEKEDDIPAMLSNNEFVMTADAVRGMGGGDVNLGAQRMYDQMKMLEAGGRV